MSWKNKQKIQWQNLPRSINIPSKDEDLAEFVGIMLGDGGVSEYFISVTLDSLTDLAYARYVSLLIYKLFGVYPKWYRRRDSGALNLVVSRKALVAFCVSIGLPIGDKIRNRVTIPSWILQSEKYTVACIRGLIDTDGSFFWHTYYSKGKPYSYLKIRFTNRSFPLLRSAYDALQKMGFNVRMTKSFDDIALDSQADVKKYIQYIGTSNMKHKEKIRRRG